MYMRIVVICIYIHTYIHIYIYTYTYVYTLCIYIYIYIYFIHMYMSTIVICIYYIYVYIHIYIYALYLCIWALYLYIYIDMYKHIVTRAFCLVSWLHFKCSSVSFHDSLKRCRLWWCPHVPALGRWPARVRPDFETTVTTVMRRKRCGQIFGGCFFF